MLTHAHTVTSVSTCVRVRITVAANNSVYHNVIGSNLFHSMSVLCRLELRIIGGKKRIMLLSVRIIGKKFEN